MYKRWKRNFQSDEKIKAKDLKQFKFFLALLNFLAVEITYKDP